MTKVVVLENVSRHLLFESQAAEIVAEARLLLEWWNTPAGGVF